MIAKDLMTANPFAVAASATVRDAADLMREHDVGMIPVVRDLQTRTFEGVITDRDIAIRCVAHGHASDGFVAAYMTKEPLATVRPESPVDEVVQLMERARVRRLPVVDGSNRVVGIIALADIVRGLGAREPGTVEEVLEKVSAASHALR
jgi:CBS domain-containing protein